MFEIDISSGALAALTLGFLLGLKHATDADHVVAVSTIAMQQRKVWSGLWVGTSWGLGHTTPLLVLGIIILIVKESVMSRYEAVAPVLEFGVGIMLVFLGAQVLYNLRRGRLHTHVHTGEAQPHVHVHATHRRASDDEPPEEDGARSRPSVFRLRSFVIGTVHGLAGSAAVMLVLLPSIDGFWVGVGYLLLFGVGTIISMGAITILLGVPSALTQGTRRLNLAVAGVAGIASLGFGLMLMSDIGLGTSLSPL